MYIATFYARKAERVFFNVARKQRMPYLHQLYFSKDSETVQYIPGTEIDVAVVVTESREKIDEMAQDITSKRVVPSYAIRESQKQRFNTCLP